MAIRSRVKDEDFEKVPINTMEQNPCTPKPRESNFKGILIQAPKRISLSQAKTIPICGYYLVSIADTPEHGNPLPHFKIIATQSEIEKQYIGCVSQGGGDEEEVNFGDLSQEEMETSFQGGYFNPNLGEIIPLPQKPCEYTVVVQMGNIKSNSIKIKIVNNPSSIFSNLK
jgi:hypothetical protein